MYEVRGCSLGFVDGRRKGLRRRFHTHETAICEIIVARLLITTYTAISSYNDYVASYLFESFKVWDPCSVSRFVSF
jgi:hypothetical protein